MGGVECLVKINMAEQKSNCSAEKLKIKKEVFHTIFFSFYDDIFIKWDVVKFWIGVLIPNIFYFNLLFTIDVPGSLAVPIAQ